MSQYSTEEERQGQRKTKVFLVGKGSQTTIFFAQKMRQKNSNLVRGALKPSNESVLTENLVFRRNSTGDLRRSPSLQKRRGESPRSCATQLIPPSTQPRAVHFFPDVFWRRLSLLSDLESAPRNFSVPLDRGLLRPRRRDERDLVHSTIRGMFSPFSSEHGALWSAALLCAVPSRCKGDTIVVSTRRWSSRRQRSPIARHQRGCRHRCRGCLTMTLVDTRPPPSLHTCAARSSANPLDLETPAPAHAARWWLLQSRRRPHRQVREEKRTGR